MGNSAADTALRLCRDPANQRERIHSWQPEEAGITMDSGMDARLLARLRDPACYPGCVDAVEIRQTHLSVVCLAGEFAYKLKKPVRFSFVDFSTRDLRRHFCEEEVRLNRRLCPELYLDTVPLLRTSEGSWSFREGSGGEIEDWAVRMRRLPDEKLLHLELAENRVTEAQIRQVARLVARFHANSEITPGVLDAGSARKKREAILANFANLEECRAIGIDGELVQAIRARTEADLKNWMPLMEDRAKRARVVDGHGDLHARNICLTEPPAIFDCIEFRAEFRCGDVAMENAFLVMDLIYRGHPALAKVYLDAYIAESGDEEQRQLMPLALCYRAMVRAVVAGLAAKDPDVPEEEREQARVSVAHHLQLAAACALSEDRVLVLACGLPGTGKSHFCQTLAQRSGWGVESSDWVRKELAGVSPGERLPAEYYAEPFSERTYTEVIRRACARLMFGCSIADANFSKADLRARAAAAARDKEGWPCLVWLVAEDALVRRRMALREGDLACVSDADWSTYEKLRDTFEAPEPAEGVPMLQLDGGATVESNVNRILAWLLRHVAARKAELPAPADGERS